MDVGRWDSYFGVLRRFWAYGNSLIWQFKSGIDQRDSHLKGNIWTQGWKSHAQGKDYGFT